MVIGIIGVSGITGPVTGDAPVPFNSVSKGSTAVPDQSVANKSGVPLGAAVVVDEELSEPNSSFIISTPWFVEVTGVVLLDAGSSSKSINDVPY